MNKDEALRLALEALQYNDHLRGEAITAIKLALEQERALQALHDENERLGLYKDAYGQPEPEPRVWIDHRVHAYPDCFVMQPEPPHTSPLYTFPPKREPLTDEEIDKLPWEPHEGNPMTFAEGLRYFARAIEAAHGIKWEA